MDDSISRKAAIDALISFFGLSIEEEYGSAIQEVLNGLPSAQPEQRWIPVKTRPMTEEERQYYSEMYGYDVKYAKAVMFDCKMPEDGQEVWVCSKCGYVWQDTCVVDEGFGLEKNWDWDDIVAWIPFVRPEPWKGEADAEIH